MRTDQLIVQITLNNNEKAILVYKMISSFFSELLTSGLVDLYFSMLYL